MYQYLFAHSWQILRITRKIPTTERAMLTRLIHRAQIIYLHFFKYEIPFCSVLWKTFFAVIRTLSCRVTLEGVNSWPFCTFWTLGALKISIEVRLIFTRNVTKKCNQFALCSYLHFMKMGEPFSKKKKKKYCWMVVESFRSVEKCQQLRVTGGGIQAWVFSPTLYYEGYLDTFILITNR